jgi:tetratricopeptide (TPR) repeat protein
MFWPLVCLGFTPFAVGQTTAVNERFRQATESMRAGQLEEAAEGFASVVATSPGFAEAHLNLGLVREEQGKNEEAIASLKKALALKPKLRGANLFLGIAEYRLNQLDAAISALHNETSNFPSDASAWMWLGVAELAKEQPENAVQALDKAVKLAPDNVDILYERGRAHLLVSKNSYAQMFKADPKSWRVHQVLAEADAEADRHEDAIAEYEAAIKLAPTQPGLHEELGVEYQKIAKLEAAGAELQRELELDPHNVLARYKLGTLQVEQGDAANGKAAIEGALRQNPDLKDADYYLGRAEMQLGNDGAAVEALKRAISANSDPEIAQQAWYQLGIVYRRMHRMTDAQQAMAMFQKLKDAETEQQQRRLQEKREAQRPNDAQPPLVPNSR